MARARRLNVTTRLHWYDEVDTDELPVDEEEWMDFGIVL